MSKQQNSDPKSNECVKVVIRCRPMSQKEMQEGHQLAVNMDMKTGAVFVSKGDGVEGPKQWTFDLVYDWTASQKNIYLDTAHPIILNVLEGYNGTIFAYGQTGTGKTHTMTGVESDQEQKGIMPRSFEDIFESITQDSEQTQFLVRASYLEIYNEEIRDLLAKNPKNRLDLHEKPDSGVYVKNLSYYAVKSADEVREIMNIGMKNRSVGETLMNAHSSRSHSLFQITVERSELGPDGKPHIRVGKLNMVDLAGSERIAKTGAQGDRLKEATKINLSLSTLCHVISSLIDPKSTYVPYRDSKLTRLLQDSLGGNTKTVMIANVGPADFNFEETINTLRYASRAKSIQNKPKINEDPKDALLREYQDEISKLKQQLQAINSGVDPSQIMSQHGVIGKQIIQQEKIVYVEDKEKMKEFEEKMEYERQELKKKAEEEKANIERQANLKEEEKKKLLEDLKKKEDEQEKAKNKQQKLISKLKKMEEKMVAGTQAIEVAKMQKKELKKTKKELDQEEKQAEKLAKKLQAEEDANMKIELQFKNLNEELDFKQQKLEKLWGKFQEAQGEANTVQEDFDRERNDMYDTIYELTNQLKLKNQIIDNFIPPEDYKKIEKMAEWNDELNDWTVKQQTQFKEQKSGAKRPQSAVGMKRPTSEYSRIAKGLGDLNPRYKFDNIIQMELDMPERTTEDYQGMPSIKVQQAIQAILNDQDKAQENVPITTLINFNDACLDEDYNKAKANASNRPKSGKRLKSAKKSSNDA